MATVEDGLAVLEVGGQEESAPDTTEAGAKILIVDDRPANLLALEAMLQGLNLRLVRARSGLEALRCLLDDDFALILMDVHMPQMDGFETATMIRQRERSQHTPIIFLTASEREDVQIFKGYSLGAVDYLCKPLNPTVLRAKVGVFVDIFQKGEEVKRQAELLREIERREHERRLAEAKQQWEVNRFKEEIRLARQIQQKLFPAAPLPLPGFDISGASYPAEATGGDYFDYIPMRDGSLAIAIGDVSGHGFGPALLMAEARAYLRAFLLTRTDLGEIASLLNQALASDAPDDRFATLLLARLEPHARTLDYVSAGHTAGYVLSPAGEVRTTLPSTSVPLAILPEAVFQAAPTVSLQPGEMVLLLTDGIVEAHDHHQDLFGVERMLASVRTHRDRSAREIIDRLSLAVREFCGERSPFDDMTVVVIKVL